VVTRRREALIVGRLVNKPTKKPRVVPANRANNRDEGDIIVVYRPPVCGSRGGITMTTSCIIYIAISLFIGACFGFCWREIVAMGAD
jgi:hypothetical protein